MRESPHKRTNQQFKQEIVFMNSIIIVKHGERLDEVQPEDLWAKYCTEHCENSFDYFCRVNDPPLTHNGNWQARNVAVSLHKELCDKVSEYIFSSKYLRCIETACEIALELDKPIVLSKAFSKTVSASQQVEVFDFISIDELENCYPGVKFVDGDQDQQGVSDCRIPSNQLSDALEFVATHFPSSVVVAHGEVIRSLAGYRLFTPSCSYAEFGFSSEYTSCATASLTHLCDANGELIDMTELPRSSPVNHRKRKSTDEIACLVSSGFTAQDIFQSGAPTTSSSYSGSISVRDEGRRFDELCSPERSGRFALSGGYQYASQI